MDEPPEQKLQSTPTLLYVSDVVGSAVRSPSGRSLGRVRDVVVRVGPEAPDPRFHGLVVRSAQQKTFVPADEIRSVHPGKVELSVQELGGGAFERRAGEMLLVKDLRDMKVVHVPAKDVVRVNDVLIQQSGAGWQVAGIDVSAAALLAQLGLSRVVTGRMRRHVIPWNELEIFASSVPVPLSVNHDKISRLHPADIAEVFQELGYRQSCELLQDLPNDLAADVVEELAPEYQATLLSSLTRERAADILEEMPADVAADVLNDIVEEDPEAVAEMVERMETNEAEEIERLRSYPDDTAGGMMTVEFVLLPESLTAADAIDRLRADREHLPPFLDQLFVESGDEPGKLVGVLGLRALVLARRDERLSDLMHRDLVVRHVDDPAREVARTIAHYNLLALPIVDQSGRIVGVVGMNEALDLILPKEWIRRMPRPYIGGHSLG